MLWCLVLKRNGKIYVPQYIWQLETALISIFFIFQNSYFVPSEMVTYLKIITVIQYGISFVFQFIAFLKFCPTVKRLFKSKFNIVTPLLRYYLYCWTLCTIPTMIHNAYMIIFWRPESKFWYWWLRYYSYLYSKIWNIFSNRIKIYYLKLNLKQQY